MTQFTYLFKFFRLPVTLFLLSFFMPCHNSSAGKESTCNAGDPNSIPGWGRAPREGIGYPLQYSWAFPGSSDVKKKKKKKNSPATWETWLSSLYWKDPLEEGWATHFSILHFPRGWGGKESACSAEDLSSNPGLGRSPGRGHGNPLQYSCLENPMDRSLAGDNPQGRRIEHDWGNLAGMHLKHLLDHLRILIFFR